MIVPTSTVFFFFALGKFAVARVFLKTSSTAATLVTNEERRK